MLHIHTEYVQLVADSQMLWVMTNRMENIIKAFNEYFGGKVDIPIELTEKGIIDDANSGWYIRYILAKDEQGNLVLDFLADHRMTNTRHHRIDSNGEISFLEMYQEAYSFNPEIAGDKEKKEQEYFNHNREVSRILIRKGLMDLKGNESLFENL